MKNTIYILTILTLFGCTNKSNKFIGHWHYSLDSSGLYNSITITDSSLSIDEFAFGEKFLFTDISDNDTIFIAEVLLFKDSENGIIGFDHPERWTKVNRTQEDFIRDLSSTLFIEFSPHITKQETKTDLDPYFERPIFIGKPKSQFIDLFSGRQDLYSKNGYYLQYGDLLLTLDDFIELIMVIDSNSEHLLIFSDKNCSIEFIEEVIEVINHYNRNLVVYRAIINIENRKIVKEKMKTAANK